MDPIEYCDEIQAQEIENPTDQAQKKTNESQQESSTKILPNLKETFLVKFYFISICQYLGVLAIFLIFQIPEFSNLLVFKRHHQWWGENYTYEDYKYQYNCHDKSYYDYLDWKNIQQNLNYEFKLRCIYIVIVVLFFLLTLGVSIGRKYKQIVQHQQKIFYFQTTFLGIILGGFAAESRNNWKYSNKIFFVVWAIILLVVNAITTIVLVKIKRIHFQKNIGRTLVYLFLPINWLVAINQGELKQSVPIFQSIIIYCLYYFNQLNQSILINETPIRVNYVDSIKTWIKELRQDDQKEDQAAKNQLNQRYFIINKKLILSMLSVLGTVSLLAISLLIKVQLFIGLLVAIVLSAISFFIETEVYQNGEEDAFNAVCSTYLDLLNPIKNIIRSFKSWLQ